MSIVECVSFSFEASTGQPYLTLGDTNNDGVFDMLTYSALSSDGKLLAEVEDFGMDGQPDFIMNFEKKSASVFYHGDWYPVKGVGTGSTPTVSIEGEERKLNEVLVELGRKPF